MANRPHGPADRHAAPDGPARVSSIVGVREAARLLGTDPRTVRRMLADKRLTSMPSTSGAPRIRRDDVMTLLAHRERHGSQHGGRDHVAERQARILRAFDDHKSLREICELEHARVEYVLELAKLWATGLPYEEPKVAPVSAVMRTAKDVARTDRAEREAATAHDARMREIDRELAEQRDAAEREHERAMKARRSG